MATKTGFAPLPYIYSDVDYYIYRNTKTEFAMMSSAFTPDQFLLDTFKFMSDCEALSADARSKQVVFRCGFLIEWID